MKFGRPWAEHRPRFLCWRSQHRPFFGQSKCDILWRMCACVEVNVSDMAIVVGTDWPSETNVLCIPWGYHSGQWLCGLFHSWRFYLLWNRSYQSPGPGLPLCHILWMRNKKKDHHQNCVYVYIRVFYNLQVISYNLQVYIFRANILALPISRKFAVTRMGNLLWMGRLVNYRNLYLLIY